MNHQTNFPSMPALAPAWHRDAASVPIAPGPGVTSGEVGTLLAELMAAETALYAVTRDWRYATAGRGFVRLHALLDEQFTEIGSRLVQLAARSRALDLHVSTGHGDRAQSRGPAVDDEAFEARILRELLDLHDALLLRLRAGRSKAADHFHDSETTNLLADLTGHHEKDAFMLRALLWEVQHTAG